MKSKDTKSSQGNTGNEDAFRFGMVIGLVVGVVVTWAIAMLIYLI